MNLLSRKSLRFLGSAMGMGIANRKNRCNFGALSCGLRTHELLQIAEFFSCLDIIDLVAHDCRYPLSRYTCRATRVAADFLDFIAFCRCSTGVALHPLKILVSHLSPPIPGRCRTENLGLKRWRATRGCRSYSCGCRATLRN